MAEPSLGSNNPFRRKSGPSGGGDTATTTTPATFGDSSYHTPPLSLDTGTAAPTVAFAQNNNNTTQYDTQPHPTATEFREQLREMPKSSEAPPSTTFVNPKPVKKVRVQTPPPLSPDSVEADFESRYPASLSGNGIPTTLVFPTPGTSNELLIEDRPRWLKNDNDGNNYNDNDNDNDNDGDSSDSEDSASAATVRESNQQNSVPSLAPNGLTNASGSSSSQQHTPSNPFQKTLKDLESEEIGGARESATSTGSGHTQKAALDVDSFRRLLLTGQADAGAAGGTPLGAVASVPASVSVLGPAATSRIDTGSVTDGSSISRQSLFDNTPRTSHEVSETDDDQSGLIGGLHSSSSQRQILRKKPPPPSSRHGKLISGSGSGTTADAAITMSVRRSFDINANDGTHSHAYHFPTEDSVPAARPPTPPNSSHATGAVDSTAVATSTTPAKKPIPAPPPRRQPHGRSDSKSSFQERPPRASTDRDRSPSGSVRSSFESAVSRTPSFKLATAGAAGTAGIASGNVPAPPPPRRINHGSRPSMSFVSPSAVSFASSPPSSETERSYGSPLSSSQPLSSSYPIVEDFNPTISFHKSISAVSVPYGGGATMAKSLSQGTGTAGTSPSATAPFSPPATTTSAPTSANPPNKAFKPPRPPTRNPSVRNKEGRFGRRPPSVSSVDGISRRVPGAHSHGQPPPPPPRQRGSSKGSMDGPPDAAAAASTSSLSLATPTPRKLSADSSLRVGHHHHSLAEEDENIQSATHRSVSGPAASTNDPSAANHILADLSALQREVDALRGQYPTGL